MLRVAILMDHPSPHMVGLLDALALRGECAMQVLYFRPGAPERRWGNPAGGLPHRFATTGQGGSSLRNAGRVVREMAAVRADIWVVNSCYTAPETWAAVHRLNASRALWVYMNEPLRPRGRMDDVKVSILRTMLRHASGVIGMGMEAQSRYAQIAAPGTPSTSVPYYLDLSEFRSLDVPAAPDGRATVNFLVVAQMIRRKGLDVLLDSCRQMPRTGWALTLAGDGPLRKSLEKAFVSSLGRDRVRFLGEIPYADRLSIFRGQHVFVFPSRWDGWGVAPVEAMAAGLPVISTDQTMSMRELVREGESGFLVGAEDSSALAARMRWFLENKPMIPAMGEAARGALEDYRPDVGAGRLVGFLRSTVEGRAEAVPVPEGKDAAPVTWTELTRAPRLAQRVRHGSRAMAKRTVIDAKLALNPRARPSGNRVLVYHLVLREDRRRFEDHVSYLRDHFRIVTVQELVERTLGAGETGLAAISFDDGFRELMDVALDVLDRRRVPATFYVPTGYISLSQDAPGAGAFSRRVHHYERPLLPMSVADLRNLARAGHEVGSHGVSHSSLGALAPGIVDEELVKSRQQISEWVGRAPSGVAYPYGDSENSVVDLGGAVERAGYRYAVTLKRGAVSATASPMHLPREHAEGNWRVRDLRYFLSR